MSNVQSRYNAVVAAQHGAAVATVNQKRQNNDEKRLGITLRSSFPHVLFRAKLLQELWRHACSSRSYHLRSLRSKTRGGEKRRRFIFSSFLFFLFSSSLPLCPFLSSLDASRRFLHFVSSGAFFFPFSNQVTAGSTASSSGGKRRIQELCEKHHGDHRHCEINDLFETLALTSSSSSSSSLHRRRCSAMAGRTTARGCS